MYTLDKHELEEIMKPHKSGFNQKQSNQPINKKPMPVKHKQDDKWGKRNGQQ